MNEGELLVNGPPQDLMRDEQARKIYLGDTFSM
jgi:ABC-type lipopolysaccharide export system ATPase subunit